MERFERAAPAFERIVRAICDRGAYDDAFVDALCEPPQSFTYGGVIAHVAHHGAIRTHALADVLRELGAEISVGDPVEWEPRPSSRKSRRGEEPGKAVRPATIACRQRPATEPVGHEVTLPDGRRGVVAAVDPLDPDRSTVRPAGPHDR